MRWYSLAKPGAKVLAQVDTSLERISSLLVERGLYVLRYESCTDAIEPPVAQVRTAQGCELSIQVVSAPGAAPGELSMPGSCVIVIADSGGALNVSMRRQHSKGSLDATLRLERLGATATLEPTSANGPMRHRSNELREVGDVARINGPIQDLSVFAILGHVSHRGDVAVASGEWIAGPESPSALEGLEIRGLQPSVEIETQVLFGSRPPKWSNWTSSGSFAGTRGRRMPLVGVRFKLNGREADQHELSAEALFLGSPIMIKRGREIEMVSAAGADSLVGLRLQLRRSVTSQPRSVETLNERPREPRVRVFRAVAPR